MATRRSSLSLLLCLALLLAPSSAKDPQKERCAKECRGVGDKRERKECERRCLQDRSREREEEGEGEDQRAPYVFREQSFKHWERSKHGHFKVLERFAKRSELLAGIENYRLAILEADPSTFVMPSHWDAEEVIYVIRGRGTISMLHDENRESYNIREGDIMRVPAGAIVYLINNHSSEKLRIVLLLNPISIPGRFKEFYGAGGEDPESFYRVFSSELLEAAFNTPREKLERLFGQQRKGTIIKASKEQIEAMSRHTSTEGGGWPFGRPSRKPINLLKKRPFYSNDYGELYEVDANDYEQLQYLDVDVSIANISHGSMIAPHYNSRATKVALVVEVATSRWLAPTSLARRRKSIIKNGEAANATIGSGRS